MTELICRTCLKQTVTSKSFQIANDANSEQVKIQLLLCLPEVDLNLLSNPIVCNSCLEVLGTSYRFKKLCLYTEERIRSYLSSTKSYGRSTIHDVYKSSSLFGSVPYVNNFAIAIPKRDYIDELNDLLDEALKSEDDELISTNEATVLSTSAIVTTHNENINQTVVPTTCEAKTPSDTEHVVPNSYINDDKISFPHKQKTSTKSHGKQSVVKLLSCRMCSFKTKQRLVLNLHNKEHNKMKKFPCEVCDFRTNFKQSLKKHSERHALQATAASSIDSVKSEASKKSLNKSLNAYICPICGYKSVSSQKFRAHILEMHKKKMHLCLICKKVFRKENNLHQHSVVHKKNVDEGNTIHSIVTKDDVNQDIKIYKCPLCDYVTIYCNGISGHMKKHKKELA